MRVCTIKDLGLDLEQAQVGRTWLLLPDAFRTPEQAKKYPLPTYINELLSLCTIPFKPQKMDPGCIYLRRCRKEAKIRLRAKAGSARNIEAAEAEVDALKKDFKKQIDKITTEVRTTADRAIASLDQLFALGREGLEGQMRAHLKGEEWKGEGIDAEAFRQCFRMVSQAVKGLGLPSSEAPRARDAIMQEVAASLRATQEAEAMKAEPEPGATTH